MKIIRQIFLQNLIIKKVCKYSHDKQNEPQYNASPFSFTFFYLNNYSLYSYNFEKCIKHTISYLISLFYFIFC